MARQAPVEGVILEAAHPIYDTNIFSAHIQTFSECTF